MTRISRNILLIVAVSLGLIPLFAGNKRSMQSRENADKAKYIFMEALRQKEQGNNGSFYELVKHAYALDSTNSIISYYLGYSTVLMENATMADAERAVKLIGKHFDAHPEDYYEGYTYGRILTQLGKKEEALRVWEKMATLFPQKIDVQGERADAYARNGEYRKAIAAFDSIEGQMGQSFEISHRKLAFYFELGDTAGMIAEGYRVLRKAPKNVDYNLLMGNVYNTIQQGDSALAYYDKAIVIAPDDGRGYLSKANYYMMHGDSVNYDKQVYNALMTKDLDVENKMGVLTGYIKQLLQQNDTTARIDKLFKVLINQHPHEVQVHDLYSQYFVARERFKEAAEQMQYVVDIDPSNPEYWKKLMMVNLMAEQFPNAIHAAEKALEYNPDNIELYQYIGPAYFQMKEYDKAIDIYNRCLEKADSLDFNLRSNVYGGLGDVYWAKKDTVQSFAYYEKALSVDPSNVSIMNNYAYFLAVMGRDLDKAESMSAKAVQAAPDNDTFLDTYAWVFFKKKDYSLARMYIEHAMKNAKEPSWELYDHYGDILFMNGEPEKALEQWQKAQELNSDSELLNRKVKHKTYFYK